MINIRTFGIHIINFLPRIWYVGLYQWQEVRCLLQRLMLIQHQVCSPGFFKEVELMGHTCVCASYGMYVYACT